MANNSLSMRKITEVLRLYDSGDQLHPGDAGYEAMAKAKAKAIKIR